MTPGAWHSLRRSSRPLRKVLWPLASPAARPAVVSGVGIANLSIPLPAATASGLTLPSSADFSGAAGFASDSTKPADGAEVSSFLHTSVRGPYPPWQPPTRELRGPSYWCVRGTDVLVSCHECTNLHSRLNSTSAEPPVQMSSEGPDRRFRCYTRTGDRGLSSLFNGERRRKDDVVFEALGDIDELNSAVGLAREYCRQQGDLEQLCDQLAVVQSRLLDVGSSVATPVSSSSKAKVQRVQFDVSSVDTLERWLDAMDDQLPVLTNFILPSGGMAAAHLHVARSVCRRAERAVVGLNAASPLEASKDTKLDKEDEEERHDTSGSVGPGVRQMCDPAVVKYLNRLSDYLFTAARYATLRAGREETMYKKAGV